MGCNCTKSKAKAAPQIQTPKSAPAPAAPKGNTCTRCGWMLKRIRYIDVSSNAIVEKINCTNPNCPTNKSR